MRIQPHAIKLCIDAKREIEALKETATHTDNLKRFQTYYIDYLLNYDSIGSYAASHNLTYETAKHRIKTGERVHLSLTESATCDTPSATGLAFF